MLVVSTVMEEINHDKGARESFGARGFWKTTHESDTYALEASAMEFGIMLSME